MVDKKAFFISLEGPDFSLKTTLRDQLYDRLKSLYSTKKNIYKISPIDYKSEESSLIRNYLNGVYGDPMEVESTASSIFYAVSRYDIVMKNKSMFEDENGIILCDRWTLSNLIYQASSEAEAKLLEFIETKMLNIPQPNMVILLGQDIELAKDLMLKTESRKVDLLESNYLDSIYDKWYNNEMYADIIYDYCDSYTKNNWLKAPVYTWDEDENLIIDDNTCTGILRFIKDQYNQYISTERFGCGYL